MRRIFVLSLLITLAMPVGMALADGLEAGGMEFEPVITVTTEDGEHELRCTGTALRKKWFFKVYAIAAYLDQEIETGEDAGATFVDADSPKRLHLHMLRGVDSHKIISSIDEALEKCSTQPVEGIAEERELFTKAFSMEKLEEGQDILFTWIPGAGLQISVDDEVLETIDSEAFGRSFFEIYFGPSPVNGGMKKDLLELVG